MKKLVILALLTTKLLVSMDTGNKTESLSLNNKNNPITRLIFKAFRKGKAKAIKNNWICQKQFCNDQCTDIQTQQIFNSNVRIGQVGTKSLFSIYLLRPHRNVGSLISALMLQQDTKSTKQFAEEKTNPNIGKFDANTVHTSFFVEGSDAINELQVKFNGKKVVADYSIQNKVIKDHVADNFTACDVFIAKAYTEDVLYAIYNCQTKATYQEFLDATK